jgi:hypothetical protein
VKRYRRRRRCRRRRRRERLLPTLAQTTGARNAKW